VQFRYHIHSSRRLIVVRFRGRVGLSEVVSGVRQLWADPHYRTDFDGVVDLESVTTRAGLPDLRELVDFLRANNGSRGRWVAVFSEPKPTALGLLFKASNTLPTSFEVVSTWEAACQHLHIDPALPRPGAN